MKRNLFKRRLIYDGNVYLFLADCADVLECNIEELRQRCSNIKIIDDLGEFLPEGDFNRVFSENYPDSPAVIQFTSVETLDAKARDLINLYPLKLLFAKDLFEKNSAEAGMSIDEYVEKIDFKEEIEKEKQRLLLKESLQKKCDEYRKEIEKSIVSVGKVPFEKYGLILQHLTILQDGKISFYSFYVGEGVFYHTSPELMEYDVWEEAVQGDNGIFIPEIDDPKHGWVIPYEGKRDFRKYSVFDNILYCVQNLPAFDEWQDYIGIRDIGINIEVSKIFLMKLVNPASFPDLYYFSGILQ